jgi:predicted RNA binding protein YcfA (HicA-like mRNA interferase family)
VAVDRYTEYLGELEGARGVRFERLLTVCRELFGEVRIKGSHHIFKTPWPGDPRINLQKDGRDAKPYQVKQVVKAIKRLEQINATQKKK